MWTIYGIVASICLFGQVFARVSPNSESVRCYLLFAFKVSKDIPGGYVIGWQALHFDWVLENDKLGVHI